jgi:hypothetical protein
MTRGSLIVLGGLPFDAPALRQIAPEFGWSLELAQDLDQLRELAEVSNPIAILFEAGSLGLPCDQAVRAVREIDSRPLLIPCYRFSDVLSWPELADAGAFHALALPLDPGEVRQSLSFVWSARFRGARALLTMPSAVSSDRRSAAEDRHAQADDQLLGTLSSRRSVPA